jgi:phosphatidylglycerophosphate synthase
VAALAVSRRVHPSVITLASLVVGTGSSAAVIALAEDARSWALPGWLALVGWQLAYVLDCADGQVARATGRTSEAGARLDVLCDYAVHCSIVCALVAVVARWYPLPVALLALAAALWFVSTLTAVLKRSDSTTDHSFVRGRNAIAEMIRMAGDNGAVVFVVGGWLLVHPQTVVVPVAGLTLLNGCYLAAVLWRDVRASMRVRSASA